MQLKFSAIQESGDRLTVPANGVGGSWIVKLPSFEHERVPENEYAMMSLAKQMGIDVPEIALLPIEQIQGIPVSFRKRGEKVYAIQRFDRAGKEGKIHIEDFAQVFGVYPEKKYSVANYGNIAKVIWSETGEKGLQEFIRRFVFNALIGNGDMHLKNWSFIYPDRKTASLAPAYDFVSTIFYLKGDALALNFAGSKEFSSLNLQQFRRFAIKGGFSEEIVLGTVEETVRQFKNVWHSIRDFSCDDALIRVIENHYKTIPIYNL